MAQGAHLENAVPVLGNLLDAEYRTDEFRIYSFKVGGRVTSGVWPCVCEKAGLEEAALHALHSAHVFHAILAGQVAECCNIDNHDWTMCAFAHVGEKARRRDTAIYKYVATACPDFRKVRRCGGHTAFSLLLKLWEKRSWAGLLDQLDL